MTLTALTCHTQDNTVCCARKKKTAKLQSFACRCDCARHSFALHEIVLDESQFIEDERLVVYHAFQLLGLPRHNLRQDGLTFHERAKHILDLPKAYFVQSLYWSPSHSLSRLTACRHAIAIKHRARIPHLSQGFGGGPAQAATSLPGAPGFL